MDEHDIVYRGCRRKVIRIYHAKKSLFTTNEQKCIGLKKCPVCPFSVPSCITELSCLPFQCYLLYYKIMFVVFHSFFFFSSAEKVLKHSLIKVIRNDKEYDNLARYKDFVYGWG